MQLSAVLADQQRRLVTAPEPRLPLSAVEPWAVFLSSLITSLCGRVSGKRCAHTEMDGSDAVHDIVQNVKDRKIMTFSTMLGAFGGFADEQVGRRFQKRVTQVMPGPSATPERRPRGQLRCDTSPDPDLRRSQHMSDVELIRTMGCVCAVCQHLLLRRCAPWPRLLRLVLGHGPSHGPVRQNMVRAMAADDRAMIRL